MMAAYSKVLAFFILCTVLVNRSSAALNYAAAGCGSFTFDQVVATVGTAMGVTPFEAAFKLTVADQLADRSFDKTWATELSYADYQNNDLGTDIVQVRKHRFSYPWGETSGGYRTGPIPSLQPFFTLETRSREVMQQTFEYMQFLDQRITGFGALFPVRPLLDGTQNGNACEKRFHSTHAELKLMTRLMRQNQLPQGSSAFISVSRHMCDYCVPIMAHLARNGGRRVAVVAPRKSSKGASNAIEQPEFIIFNPDGGYTRYKRAGESADDSYTCTRFTVTGQIPAGLDTYHPPPAPAARQLMLNNNPVARQLLNGCPDEKEGPTNACVTFIRPDLTKSVDCARGKTLTGIYGKFGPDHPGHLTVVLKSIGIYCDVTSQSSTMGGGGVVPFDIKCPKGYQVTGLRGNFGTHVTRIGIICARVIDGLRWKSPLSGTEPGGVYQEKECERRAAGHQVRLWLGTSIDGLGVCCR